MSSKGGFKDGDYVESFAVPSDAFFIIRLDSPLRNVWPQMCGRAYRPGGKPRLVWEGDGWAFVPHEIVNKGRQLQTYLFRYEMKLNRLNGFNKP